jgi:glutathionyl-hydroquinone reductase
LQDVISVTVVHPIWQTTRPENDGHRGWVFANPHSDLTLTNSDGNGGPFPAAYAGNEPDPLFGSRTIRDLYDRAGDTEGKYTVPILWDKAKGTIVSNESAEIIRMFNSEFNEFAGAPDLDLRPEELSKAIDEVNSWVYDNINNGVYRCGFAKSQTAYDKAINDLTEAFDKVDQILQKQRFIAGDRFTEADVRLFVTLVRFDEVYTVYFKCNTRSVTTTPAILNYCREVYQMMGVKETVDMEQIKLHYYASHPNLNFYSIVPKGNDFIELLNEPHDREKL